MKRRAITLTELAVPVVILCFVAVIMLPSLYPEKTSSKQPLANQEVISPTIQPASPPAIQVGHIMMNVDGPIGIVLSFDNDSVVISKIRSSSRSNDNFPPVRYTMEEVRKLGATFVPSEIPVLSETPP